MLTIPFVPSIGAYEFNATIDDQQYIFDVRWNGHPTSPGWYFDVYEHDKTLMAAGLRIVLGVYIGKTVIHRLFRTGVMIAADTTKQGRDATFDDLGTRVEVRWFPLDEWFLRMVASGFSEL